MNTVYFALQGAYGYFEFLFKNGSRKLIYTTPYSLTKLNFEGLHLQDAEMLEIELRVITDYDLHNSSNMKEGFSLIRVPLKEIEHFEKYVE